MSGPLRLRDGDGAARRLMAGAVMPVPSASRRRAVAFTSAVATIGASSVAAAASTASLIKSFVLGVALGALGGGAVSFAASETIARFETKSADHAPRPLPTEARGMPAGLPHASEPVIAESSREAAAAPLPVETVVKETGGKQKSFARDEAAELGVEASAQARQPAAASLVEEQRIVESARAAVARSDLRAALSLLDDYDRAYPSKQFWPEALALRIEALRGTGQLALARALAADFAQKYPHHPLLPRIQSSVAR